MGNIGSGCMCKFIFCIYHSKWTAVNWIALHWSHQEYDVTTANFTAVIIWTCYLWQQKGIVDSPECGWTARFFGLCLGKQRLKLFYGQLFIIDGKQAAHLDALASGWWHQCWCQMAPVDNSHIEGIWDLLWHLWCNWSKNQVLIGFVEVRNKNRDKKLSNKSWGDYFSDVHYWCMAHLSMNNKYEIDTGRVSR